MDNFHKNLIDQSNLSSEEKTWLWCFHHSTPTGEISYDGEKENIYCCLFNCCPGNLELKLDKVICKKDKVCLMICCAIYFI
jgi:hypothetical protein